MDHAEVETSVDEAGIYTITLNGPASMNGLAPLTMNALAAAFDDAVACGARVLLLTGAGRAFCGGADLRHAHTFDEIARREHGTTMLQAYCHPMLRAMRNCPLPTGPGRSDGRDEASVGQRRKQDQVRRAAARQMSSASPQP
ncbi:enoyl-CoA hydratase/isomerase family protein [Chachezhania sediminis]|uniref:enoyl-CoA hydratase/isomerase family protein n=1 Tax=Chachezhania sediminis TaxID=2599291 RepID=UPI00131B5590|nr:enoyl-CoA hydratase/isomerase family protein [Chachezhania sediminis]